MWVFSGRVENFQSITFIWMDIKSDPNNYRPVSILPVVSKIIEKVIFKQLYEYLTHNKLLAGSVLGPLFIGVRAPSQFGLGGTVTFLPEKNYAMPRKRER